ncbi:MAG: hypothetical protein HQL95_12740 [Magnetococcales bacterium]|nr:hypothetical protein [Magnetococcales bacterium]
MLDWIFTLLDHPVTPWIPTILIPLWALTAWWLTRENFLDPLHRQLREAQQLLDETPDTTQGFIQHFSRLDLMLTALPDIAKAWRHFTATLIQADDSQGVLLCTQRPENFFGYEALLSTHLRTQRLEALPTWLAGAGLLFTFLGLVGALHFAARGLNTGDAELSRQALRGMLGMASLKFLASIAGFVSAWIMAWRSRVWQRRLAGWLDTLCDQLNTRLEFITPERLTMEQHRQSDTQDTKPDPLIRVLREENNRLIAALKERHPDLRETTAAVQALHPTLQSIHQRLATLLEAFEQHLRTPLTGMAPGSAVGGDPTAWGPLLEGLREEGRQLAREISLQLTQSAPGEASRTMMVDGAPLLARSEQESWMRIVDRMEVAARALEKQAESLHGLSALAQETRRANEGSIRAGREAVDSLMNAVESFNTRMDGTFTRSAEVLLTRLTQNNQKVVAQVIAGLDRDQAGNAIIVPEVEERKELPNLFEQFLTNRGRGKAREH